MESVQKSAAETAETGRNLSVELLTRSLSSVGARPQQERVVDYLEALKHDERINSYTITVWGAGISPESASARTETGRAILKIVEELNQWAQQHDLSFPAPFETREISSMITDERDMVISFPTMCLVVREGTRLRCVAPWVADTLTHSLRDCLDELAIGDERSAIHDWPSPRNIAG